MKHKLVTLKRRLEKRLSEHSELSLKAMDNTRREAKAFWYGYNMAINEVIKLLEV